MKKLLNDNINIIKKLINLITQNNIIFHKDFPLSLENKSKEISLLNNKRNLQMTEKDSSDYLLFKKELDLCPKKMNNLNKKANILKLTNQKISFVNSPLIISENKNEDNCIFNSNESINQSNKIILSKQELL